MTVLNSLKQGWRKKMAGWLDRRIPLTREITLSHRSIFIVPSRIGWLFALLLVVLLITAVNYQNSLIYGLTFWLFCIAMAAMFFTFRNLSGLTLATGHAYSCFAGDVIDLPVRLSDGHGRAHQALDAAYPENPEVTVDVYHQQASTFSLSFRTQKRGYLKPGRLRLQSRFPFGLYTCWTWVGLDYPVLIYPKPERTPFQFATGEGGETLTGQHSGQQGQQDFQGLRGYQPGDSMRQIAWKQLARGKGLVTKEFDSDEGATCWLDWQSLSGVGVEQRLSRLCGWVLMAEQKNWRYGLNIPGHKIMPDHGEVHRDQCLTALALFGQEGAA